jgi:uncharacterized membrane protein YGL010W
MDMLTGYAAAHQHPFNVAVHLVGIPIIMLGVFIPLSRVSIGISETTFNLAQIGVVCLFVFYATLDLVFALVFLVLGMAVAWLATLLGNTGSPTFWYIAAVAFFGGYAAQFIGHAVEKSVPVVLRHPVQANLAAPFFTVVELFNLAGWRKKLFDAVQDEISVRRAESGG